MKSVSTIALAAALSLGGGTFLAAPAAAQAQTPQTQAPAQPQRTYNLSAAERAALAPLQQAIDARDYAAAQAALPAARAAAQGADARYVVGQLLLRWGIDTQNTQIQAEAVDALIQSGAATAQEMPLLLQNQAALAMSAGNRQAAERALTQIVELNPNNAQAIAQLAAVKNELGRQAEAVTLLERAITISESAGQRAPESWYRLALRLSFDSRSPQALNLARAYVAAYPTAVNWRDGLLILREMSQPDEQTQIDIYRLMRATNALSGERDYHDMAVLLHQRGLPGEASAILQEGVQRRQVDASEAAFRELIAATGRSATQDRATLAASVRDARAATAGRPALTTADALFGYGRYQEAVELYRAALQRGGVDADTVNTRLGAALALAGQRAEAEAAFRAVSGGPRAQLAQFWLAYLAQRPS